MKIYISGKISGLPTEQVAAKFDQAENQVLAAGHTPVNPFKQIDQDLPWEKQMGEAIGMMLECEGVYLLKDWTSSKGARIELYAAQQHGIEVIHQQDFAAFQS